MPVIKPFPSDDELPTAVDVVIVGGGIIGVSAALSLADRGISVLLCEKGEIAAEQSSRNWGWVRVMGRDKHEVPLAVASLEIWRGLDTHYGIDTGFTEAGITYLCRSEKEVDGYRTWSDAARDHGIN
jgi:glycine/D-amino acid oxidase-like deaminating enzyme